MKTLRVLIVLIIFSTLQTNAQGLISPVIEANNEKNEFSVRCGSYELLKNIEHTCPGFLNYSNSLIKSVAKDADNKSIFDMKNNVYLIPVVFHIVYNNSNVNIPDSVIHDQLAVLNKSFRRTNPDTSNTRPEFYNIVGDAEIMFVLADKDPAGNPTTGITRTNSPIAYFGGTLPYGPGQNQQIIDWINDSLFFNIFRITQDELGGKNAWNPNKYLNIWISDLRIFEPYFNNFLELVFFGLATPPVDHHNWPDSVLQAINEYEQGVIMHFVNVGSNNPNLFPAPYHIYNGLVTTGKLLVHEVGHFLGLRHIWGDGDCTHDDFIYDTPNSDAASQFNCNHNRNSCVDDIYGVDLPDMVENYMDYSSGDCQNSFTIGQIQAMRNVLKIYRPLLAESFIENTEDFELSADNAFEIYPNPTTGEVSVRSAVSQEIIKMNLREIGGSLIKEIKFEDDKNINFEISGANGVYILEIMTKNGRSAIKILKF